MFKANNAVKPQIPPIVTRKLKRPKEQDVQSQVQDIISPTVGNEQEDEFDKPSPEEPSAKRRRTNSSSATPSSLKASSSGSSSVLEMDTDLATAPGNGSQLETSIHSSKRSSQSSFHTISPTLTKPKRTRIQVPPHEPIPVMTKLQVIQKIAPPLSFSSSTLRGAVIAVEGEDPVVTRRLISSLKDTLNGTVCDNVIVINPSDVTSYANKEDHDVVTARFLQNIALWRLKTEDIRKTITTSNEQGPSPLVSSPVPLQIMSPPLSSSLSRSPIVIIDRYILSQCNEAAHKLSMDSDTQSAIEHWYWCASIWRGCVGADMTILIKDESAFTSHGSNTVEPMTDGVVMVTAPITKEWEGGAVRRVAFEIGECLRSLKGMES